jgi:biotin operon repressor
MAANKRTPIEREADLLKIAKLYFEGKQQVEIANELNITQQQISYDLKTLQTRWTEGAKALIDEAKGRELAKLDNLEREYWTGWVDSKKEYRGTTAERTRGKNFGTKVQIKKEQRLGDPRFLDGVRSCIERRCKILGLEAPTKAQVSIDKMTNDELINFITGKA